MTPMLRPLALISALCSMGFMAFNAIVGLLARELHLADWMVGLIVSAAGVALMLSTRAWGRRSDRLGRVPVVRLGLVGFVLGFALLSIYLLWALNTGAPWVPLSLAVLLLGRVAVGVFQSAVLTASQAMVADLTTAQTRAAGMASLGLGQALGMVIGPAVASVLAVWSLNAPVVGAVACGLLAWVVARRALVAVAPAEAFRSTALRFADPRLRLGLVTAFCAMSCVMSAQIVTGFFAQDRFALDSRSAATLAGGALAAVGLALMAAQLLVRRGGLSPRGWIMTGAAIAAVGFGSALFVEQPWQMLAGYALSGFGMGMVFPGFQAANANAVQPHEQGAAAGTLGAVQALGIVVAPGAAALLYDRFGPAAPFLMSSGLMLLALVFAATRSAAVPQPREAA